MSKKSLWLDRCVAWGLLILAAYFLVAMVLEQRAFNAIWIE